MDDVVAAPLPEPKLAAPPWRLKALTLAVVALVLFANRQPQWYFNDAVRHLAGNPAYRGPWLLVEHALLSSSAVTAVSVPAWLYLAKRGAVSPLRDWLRMPRGRAWIAWALVAGLVPLAVNVGVMVLLARSGGGLEGLRLGFTPPNGWLIVGNFVSNFYEELVFRGFLVVAFRFVFGKDVVAWVLAAAAHAYGHTQYPIEEKLMMGTFMVGWAWLVTRTRSIWPAWVAHEVIDLIGDSIVQVG